MEEFHKTDINEQETHILIDYAVKSVRIYTSKASIYKRLCKKLGEPTRKYYIKGEITGADWEIKFNDKIRLKSVFSRPVIIGSL